jgi:anti-sigma B factor antagonist
MRGVTVVDVAESFSRASFLKLLDVVKEAIKGGAKYVLLNMAKLAHIDSQGIGLLVLVHDECGSAGGRMALCSLSRSAAHVLKLAGIETFFRIHPDEDAGVSALAEEAAAATAEPKAAASGGEPKPREIPTDPAELAEAAREVVHTTIRSRRHQEAIEFFGNRVTKLASLDEIAFSLSVPRLTAEHVMRDLCRNGIVLEDGEMFIWQPSPEAEYKLALFRRALGTPKIRPRLMAWLYAEEKK